MQLKFLAREDQYVRVPDLVPVVGQAAAFVGRVFDISKRAYPATKDPYEVDSESRAGQRLIERVRRDRDLWAADEETAHACGIPFVELAFTDSYSFNGSEVGAWIAKPKADEKPTRRIVSPDPDRKVVANAEGSAS